MALYQAESAHLSVLSPCQVCHNFHKRSLRFGDQIRYAADFAPEYLLKSASTCHLCQLIHKAINEDIVAGAESLENTVAWIYLQGPSDKPPRTLSLEIYFKDTRPKLELEIYSKDDDGEHNLLVGADPYVICGALIISLLGTRMTFGQAICTQDVFRPSKPLSNDSISWVQSRIAKCVKEHIECSNKTVATLPRRILWLNQANDGAIEVSLKETNFDQGIYACLSHRWGGSEFSGTTKNTYASMLKCIPWETIPRTFQEAIRFILSLGIRNIWIDCYCIIQDDSIDWQAEAANMSSIYESSYITLAATASSGNQTGCFWESNDSFERTFESNGYTFSVRKKMKHWDTSWNSNAAFPLLSRAWVFQERLLAPRLIHFSQNELVWECGELGDCQCGGYNVSSNPKTLNWLSTTSWASAVELFTSLHLTIQQDRLPAFFGFASFFARSVGAFVATDYYAGLWKNTLRNDLLWRVDPTAHQATRICCCFDSSYDSDANWRCQYSYSTACSVLCLSQRRLCRYGNLDSAVPYNFSFRSSCIGDAEFTTIRDLKRVHPTDPLRHGREPFLGPTWSWASRNIRVLYWRDIPVYKSRSGCEIQRVSVDYDKIRHIGPITSAALTLNGYVTPALVQYQSLPDSVLRRIRHHNIFSYGLEIREKYMHLDFYPDYILCSEGEKWIPPTTGVFLIHITAGVHLVIKEKKFFELGREARLASARANSKFLQEGRVEPYTSYMRIGILRVPDHDVIRTESTYWATRIDIS